MKIRRMPKREVCRRLCLNYKARIQNLGLTVERFAAITGFPISTLYKWTNLESPFAPSRVAWRVLAALEKDHRVMIIFSSLTLEDEAGE